MRNTWIIFQKELRSYFVSPIAWLLLTMFAVIFGFFFWNAVGMFVFYGIESQMRGQSFPMNVNEQVIRPLLSNISVVGLFFIPMITSPSRMGEVVSNSMVPERFSSAKRRMVMMGMKNNPITLALFSSGRMICSFTFMGIISPRICDSMPT